MSVTTELNQFQRNFISFLYRFILIIYSWFLIIYEGTDIDNYINIIISLLFIILTIYLKGAKLTKSLLRIFLDYTLITYIIWQINTQDIYAFTLLFIPILNSQNHSGSKKTGILYLLPLITIYITGRWSFSIWLIVPFLTMYLINSFSSIREKYSLFIEELNSYADNFFEKKENYQKPHEIYDELIKMINRKRIFYTISDVVCIHITKSNTSIINGSKFIWSLEVKDEKGFIKKANSQKYFTNHKILIDGVESNTNLIINCNIMSNTYCYLFIPQVKIGFIENLKTKLIVNLLRPFLFRYSRILKSNFEQKMNELNQLRQLQEKYIYVTNSVNAMHFIRNKLSPLKNYLAMVEEYNLSTNAKKKKIEPYLITERKKLQSSIGEISDKADFVLKKSNNPFNVYKVEQKSIEHLFSLVSKIWQYHFSSTNFEIQWKTSNSYYYNIRYNITGVELVLTNWISNIYKYNSGKYGVDFLENEKYYEVLFYNSVENSTPKSTTFIEDYNNENRDTINRRETHGLLEIKDFVSQMRLETNMYLKDDILYFTIKFKKYEKS